MMFDIEYKLQEKIVRAYALWIATRIPGHQGSTRRIAANMEKFIIEGSLEQADTQKETT